ncbi:hypothetical protein QAD02_003649 [Eretmocerus hayati]|uniref:Uncharacterized protein n=1 Tax=Eretmocerus hayati TaxID=131215 RepID=A0ACC2NS68_9HYME|nr:hypothetical protein QAD02_003649 [Eretmocerus hayati]
MEGLKNKDIDSLLNRLKYVRISNFVTPSFFYVQLLDEDIIYNRLELELLDFYGSENLDDQLSTIWSGLKGAVLKELNSTELKPGMMVTTDINGRWLRYKVLHSKFYLPTAADKLCKRGFAQEPSAAAKRVALATVATAAASILVIIENSEML